MARWRSTTADGPLGWLAPARAGELLPGGSLFRQGDSLRRALDAALSSPSGLGVAVDDDGRVAGVVRAAEVLAAIEQPGRLRQGRALMEWFLAN